MLSATSVSLPVSRPSLALVLSSLPIRLSGRVAAWGARLLVLGVGSLIGLGLLLALLPAASGPDRLAGAAWEGRVGAEVEVERTVPVLQALAPTAPELERPVRETGAGTLPALGAGPGDLPDPSPAPAPGLMPTAPPAHVLHAACCPHAHPAPQQPLLRPPTA